MPRSLSHLLGLLVGLPALQAAPDFPEWQHRMQPLTPLAYTCRATSTAPVIDGRLDDAAWRAVPWTSDFVDIEGDLKPRPRFRTRVKMTWDDRFLYVAAELEEPHVWATLTQHDSVIFQDPDFEVFIDPDGDTHQYYEFEINALNTGWDLRLVKPYQDGGPALNAWEIPGLKTAVNVNGTLNRSDDVDRGWTVEIAFPWSALGEYARHPGPPREGETWRINFSRVQWTVTLDGGRYRKVPGRAEDNWVWTPQGVIDMHRPEMWGLLRFAAADAPDAPAHLPAKSARDRVLGLYYAQRDFFARHQRWATTLLELAETGFAPDAAPVPTLRLTPEGYEAKATTSEGSEPTTWSVRQDRQLQITPDPDAPKSTAAP